MLIKARLQASDRNKMFPSLPTSRGNIAYYGIIVRQNGVVVEGRYTFDGVPDSDYSSIICVYYDRNDAEITRLQSSTKPGYCDVTEAYMPGVKRLEMQVIGIYSPPTGGFINLAGTYAPSGGMSNYGSIFGGGNSEICTTMNVNSYNMPAGQINVDQNAGTLTWTIAPKRVDPNSIVRLQKILVQTTSYAIGSITVTPYAGQINNQPVQLNSISGQANLPITGFPNDYNADIVFFLVTMFPIYPGNMIDPNQVSITVNVDYCSIITNPNTSPMINGIQPYFMQNNNNNNYNPLYQQPRMFPNIFLNLFYQIFLYHAEVVYVPSGQQPGVAQTYNAPQPATIIRYTSGQNNGKTFA
jgi:hypothetical protein